MCLSFCDGQTVVTLHVASLVATERWESRIVDWCARYCGALSRISVPVGLSCPDFEALTNVFPVSDEPISVTLSHVQRRTMEASALSCFDGTSEGACVTFVGGRLRHHLADSFLTRCPVLERVSILISCCSV